MRTLFGAKLGDLAGIRARLNSPSVRFLIRHGQGARVRGRSAGGEATNDYNPSRIRFEADDKTRSFASGVSDIEAFALIDKMLEVYNFPKDRALEYIGKP